MRYETLGTTGMKVSQLCLGTNVMGAYVDDEASAKIINAFINSGGNFIDTANAYNEGKSEAAIGKAVKGLRHDVIIATKVNMPMGEGPNDRGSSRSHIMHAVEQSLRRLQTDYIDLYILHHWDNETRLEESLRAMDDLVRQGKIRYVGVSNFSAWQVTKSLWVADSMGLDPVRSVQVQYSYLHRDPELELLPMAEAHGLSVTPFWVFSAGMFAGRYQRGEEPSTGTRFKERPSYLQRFMRDPIFDMVDKVGAVAADAGHSPAEITIAWALSKPAISSILIGSSRPEQVKANCDATEIALSATHLEALEQIRPQ